MTQICFLILKSCLSISIFSYKSTYYENKPPMCKYLTLIQSTNINILDLQSCALNAYSSYVDDKYSLYLLPEHALTQIESMRSKLVQNELLLKAQESLVMAATTPLQDCPRSAFSYSKANQNQPPGTSMDTDQKLTLYTCIKKLPVYPGGVSWLPW